VSVRGVSRQLYALAFEAVVGRPMVQLADMAGRTEQAIITETLALNDVDPATSLDDFYVAGACCVGLCVLCVVLGGVHVGEVEGVVQTFDGDGDGGGVDSGGQEVFGQCREQHV
jgi:hypothetical protein